MPFPSRGRKMSPRAGLEVMPRVWAVLFTGSSVEPLGSGGDSGGALGKGTARLA